jgi:hypothetical protein
MPGWGSPPSPLFAPSLAALSLATVARRAAVPSQGRPASAKRTPAQPEGREVPMSTRRGLARRRRRANQHPRGGASRLSSEGGVIHHA